MRVAALYDIHGNLQALESMLEELQRLTIDQIVVGGDVLGGPMQVDCIESE
jgi:Icc-related predicted phosphoesterase